MVVPSQEENQSRLLEVDAFKVSVLPGTYSAIENLGFSFKISSYTGNEMTLKITFDNPI